MNVFRFVENKEEFNKITEEMLNENKAEIDERIVQMLDRSGSNIWDAVQMMLEFVSEAQTDLKEWQFNENQIPKIEICKMWKSRHGTWIQTRAVVH